MCPVIDWRLRLHDNQYPTYCPKTARIGFSTPATFREDKLIRKMDGWMDYIFNIIVAPFTSDLRGSAGRRRSIPKQRAGSSPSPAFHDHGDLAASRLQQGLLHAGPQRKRPVARPLQ